MEYLLWGVPLRLERVESLARSAGWDARFLQRDQGPLGGAYSVVTGQSTTLAWGEADRSVHTISVHPDQLALFVAWRRPFGLGGTSVETSEVLVLPPGRELEQIIPPRCEIATLFLPWRRLVTAAEALRLDLVPRRETAVLTRDDEPGRRFERALDRLRDAALANPSAWDEREGELAAALCVLLSGAAPRRLAASGNESGAAHARRTRDLIESRFRDVIRMEDICLEVGIGARQIERCFRARYGISPLAYVKLRRLHEARALLLHGCMGASVTDAALGTGFAHLGRFAAEYRRLFGEHPSASIKAAKSPSPHCLFTTGRCRADQSERASSPAPGR